MSTALPERNQWVRRVAVALTIIVGLYGFVGWAGAGQWLFAGLCLVAQAGANNCSAQAQRARNREGVGGSFVFMVAAMVGFSFFSAFSLEHAWARQNGGAEAFDLTHAASDPMFYLFVFLAVVEPAMYWAVEAIERAPSKPLPTPPADADRDAAIANAPNVSTLRQTHVMAATAAASLLALGASGRTADALPMTQEDARHDARQTQGFDAPVTREKTRAKSQAKTRVSPLEQRKRDAAALLTQGGLSNRAIGERVGLSPKTVDRIAKAMTPLQGEAA